jgi:hypothetical protein
MDSSAAFETTYFPSKVVLGFQPSSLRGPCPVFLPLTFFSLFSHCLWRAERTDGGGNPLHTHEYRSLFHEFSTPEELEALLTSAELKPRDGQAFFQSVYGTVDGQEPQRIIEGRGMRQSVSRTASSSDMTASSWFWLQWQAG